MPLSSLCSPFVMLSSLSELKWDDDTSRWDSSRRKRSVCVHCASKSRKLKHALCTFCRRSVFHLSGFHPIPNHPFAGGYRFCAANCSSFMQPLSFFDCVANKRGKLPSYSRICKLCLANGYKLSSVAVPKSARHSASEKRLLKLEVKISKPQVPKFVDISEPVLDVQGSFDDDEAFSLVPEFDEEQCHPKASDTSSIFVNPKPFLSSATWCWNHGGMTSGISDNPHFCDVCYSSLF